MSAPKKFRTWHYYIDEDGNFWHEGTELDDPELVLFFLKNLQHTSEGKLQLLCQGELCEFTCADAPYVIQNIDLNGENILLHFLGNYSETLEPSSLRVGNKNILYCKVKKGEFEARFSRKAYMELSQYIEQDDQDHYCLRLNGKRYPIQGI